MYDDGDQRMTFHAKATAEQLSLIPGDDVCVEKLSPYWDVVESEPAYPLRTQDVCRFLDRLGYEVTEDVLAMWGVGGTVPGVMQSRGCLEWGPRSTFIALLNCEGYRRWQPLHPAHLHKLTPVELSAAKARVQGLCAFDDLDKVDADSMVGMLGRETDPGMRHLIAVGLREKLRQLGVLDS